jgi:uncharacterized membrane protein
VLSLSGHVSCLPNRYNQELIAGLAIALALPLLVFTLNMRDWFKIAGKAILSFMLIVLSVSALSFIGFLWISKGYAGAWKISGMAVGLYTGGTPNLAAIKTALDVDANTYVTVHTYDTLVSTVFLLFVITAGKRVFLKFLLPFNNGSRTVHADDRNTNHKKILSPRHVHHQFRPDHGNYRLCHR